MEQVKFHLYSPGDRSVGINGYDNTLRIDLDYKDDDLVAAIEEVCKEVLDIHPSVIRCSGKITGPLTCPVCFETSNRCCPDCGQRKSPKAKMCRRCTRAPKDL